jgi:hypothetical protein
MTQDEKLLDNARESGLLDSRDDWDSVPEDYKTSLLDFARLVAEGAKESSAQIVENYPFWLGLTAKAEIASAIRAQGKS